MDDYLIQEQEGVKRTLHQPVKDFGGQRPIIYSKPTTTLMALGTIVFDPKLGKYVAFLREHSSSQMFRATSSDGLQWDETRHEDLTPISMPLDLEPGPDARGRPGLDLFSCYYNRKDSEYPYQGWLYYANYGYDREGIYYVQSRDGLTWERGDLVVNAYAGPGDSSSRTIHQEGKTVYGPGDVTLFSYDALEDRYLGLFKFFTTQDAGEGNNLRGRAYLFLDALDEPVDLDRFERIALLPPAADRDGDTRYDEYYASTAWRYGSMWLGGLKVYHLKGDYPHSAAGCAFLKLAASRDGLDWNKVSFANDAGVPEVFIPNGPEGGNEGLNDGGYLTEFSQGPLRIGDELVFYYGCSSYGKNHPRGTRMTGGGIFRARLRPDGFVSVDAGTLTTRTLVFDGADLFLNAAGSVRVEVLGREGRKLAETSFSGDALAYRLRFGGQTLRQVAGADPIRLRFTVLPGARLFSFTVQ